MYFQWRRKKITSLIMWFMSILASITTTRVEAAWSFKYITKLEVSLINTKNWQGHYTVSMVRHICSYLMCRSSWWSRETSVLSSSSMLMACNALILSRRGSSMILDRISSISSTIHWEQWLFLQSTLKLKKFKKLNFFSLGKNYKFCTNT